MKENMELERKDLKIDHDMEVDCDICQQITCYIETWFDTDKKFCIHTDADEGTCLNMYGKYNPFADTLHIECEICGDDFSDSFDYQPTATETQLIKDMITEKIREVHGQTPKEFCEEFYGTDDIRNEHSQTDTDQEEKVYVYQSRETLSAEQITAKHKRIQAHCEECGYLRDGSISISVPMSRSGNEFKNMIDYCKVRGISKILVDSLHDIGEAPADIDKVVGYLCGHGFEVEAVDCGLTFAPKTENEDQGITMGGM